MNFMPVIYPEATVTPDRTEGLFWHNPLITFWKHVGQRNYLTKAHHTQRATAQDAQSAQRHIASLSSPRTLGHPKNHDLRTRWSRKSRWRQAYQGSNLSQTKCPCVSWTWSRHWKSWQDPGHPHRNVASGISSTPSCSQKWGRNGWADQEPCSAKPSLLSHEALGYCEPHNTTLTRKKLGSWMDSQREGSWMTKETSPNKPKKHCSNQVASHACMAHMMAIALSMMQ